MNPTTVLLAAAALALVLTPLALILHGAIAARHHGSGARAPSRALAWRAAVASMLLCALAFNLVVLAQEIFLVVPKALTPGLQPTLYHNNHTWQGEHPLASLFQGTGAAATLLLAALCAWRLSRGRVRSATIAWLLFWLIFHGAFMALPQLVIGAITPGNDVGMAMDYFALDMFGKSILALLALLAIPLIARWLVRAMPTTDLSGLTQRATRARDVLCLVTLPGLLAIALIVPFRMPRDWIEVVLLPVIVILPGVLWMQAWAWRAGTGGDALRPRVPDTLGPALPAAALIALLLFFQFVLRPGVAFYR
jgi:hypothetical protein